MKDYPSTLVSINEATEHLQPLVERLASSLNDRESAPETIWRRVERAINKGTTSTPALLIIINKAVESLTKETTHDLPAQITRDTAYELLLPYVTSMAAKYGEELQDDIAQAMWVKVYESLRDGPEETGILIKSLRFAGVDEAERHRRMGFTPFRSEVSDPPTRQLVPGLGFDDRDDDDGELVACYWGEPSTMTVETSEAALTHLLTLCETDDQREVVAAGARIKARHDYDQDSVKLGYQCSLREETGLSARRVRDAQQQLTGIFKSEFGHAPLNR